MSRHEHEFRGDDGQPWIVVCGYDEPLSEYFLQVYMGDKPVDEDDPNDGLLFSIGSHYTMMCHPEYPGKMHWSNGEMLEQMEKWDCEKEHKYQVALDLPF